MTRLFFVLIFSAAACGEAPSQQCDFTIGPICFATHGHPIDRARLVDAVVGVDRGLDDLGFPARLSTTRRAVTVHFRSGAFVRDFCGQDAVGCYLDGEAWVDAEQKKTREVYYTTSHELLHHVSLVDLGTAPALEHAHMTPGLWVDWAEVNRRCGITDTVEGVARQEVRDGE